MSDAVNDDMERDESMDRDESMERDDMERDDMERDDMERDDERRAEWSADESARRDLARWFDGELPGDRRERIGKRLEREPEAAQTIEFFTAIREAIRSRPRESAPAGFAERVVRAAFGGADSPWSALEPFVRRLALAASVLLLVSIGIWLGLRDDADRPGAAYRLSAGLPRSAIERALLGEEWAPLPVSGTRAVRGMRENER